MAQRRKVFSLHFYDLAFVGHQNFWANFAGRLFLVEVNSVEGIGNPPQNFGPAGQDFLGDIFWAFSSLMVLAGLKERKAKFSPGEGD